MIIRPDAEGCVAVLQSAHALMAFQLADHWGNRSTPRPSPRADVLAAVMLHDAGWDGREEPPRLASNGSPVAFDTLPEAEHEDVWRGSVERAAVRGSYVAYLVSHHVSHLAATYGATPRPEFLALEEERRRHLVAELVREPAWAAALRSRADAVNRAVVRLADAIAVLLARGTSPSTRLADVPYRGDMGTLELRRLDGLTYRVRPWPFVGRRLRVRVEGRRLPALRFSDEAALRRAWRDAEAVWLSWNLLAPGEPAA